MCNGLEKMGFVIVVTFKELRTPQTLEEDSEDRDGCAIEHLNEGVK